MSRWVDELVNFDESLDGAERGFGELLEMGWDLLEGDAMRDPRASVDFTVADQLDDVGEILGHRVARGEKSEFATVEDWGVREC